MPFKIRQQDEEKGILIGEGIQERQAINIRLTLFTVYTITTCEHEELKRERNAGYFSGNIFCLLKCLFPGYMSSL